MFLLSTALGFASQPVTEDCRLPAPQDACDGCTETGPGDNFISFLTLDQFKSKLDEGAFDVLVDVRKAEDYAVGHIPGAYNAPGLAKLPITDALPSNLGDCTAKIVAVQCRTGYLARAAGRNLQARGFE